MIKKILFLFFACLITIGGIHAQSGYSYSITIAGMEDTVLYFGHHYGNKQYVIDTVQTDENGTAIISGSDSLPGGIYLVVMPKLGNKYFEIIGGEKSFSLTTTTDDFTNKMQVEGSLENKLMYDDLRFINPRREEISKLKEQLGKIEADSKQAEKITADIETINQEVLTWRNDLLANYPNAFYIKVLKAAQDIDLPDAPLKEDGTPDKAFLLHYVKQHFFDNIDFQDERLLRTNLLGKRIDQYMNSYVPKTADSINVAIDFIVEKTRGNNEVFQYVVVTFLNQYATSDIMGMDAVFVHVVDKYYKTGEAFWLDDAGLFRITSKADNIRPTLLGKLAPPIMLQDTANIDIPLYSLTSPYTVIVFWDVDCGHCKKEMPKLVAAYPGLKELGAEVYAVYAEEEWDKWKDWLNEQKYPWVNVGNMKKRSNFQVQYNIDQTPMIFVIDSNKKIIAKKLGAEQLVDFLKKYKELNGQ
jgi:thiol-disulfide isomerase/thioredoxin